MALMGNKLGKAQGEELRDAKNVRGDGDGHCAGQRLGKATRSTAL